MDTRYWGPSGWRLLHLISFSGAANRADLCAFFEVLPYVLPCKWCRHSLSGYIQKDPVECALKEDRLPRWLWRIHNDVNAKLRGQGIPTAPDPSFAKVKQVYEERLAAGCSRTVFEGWEFLFSVADTHPKGRDAKAVSPIPGHPPMKQLAAAGPLERNRWNVMTPEERLPFYAAFWRLLPKVLPFPEWSKAWKEVEGQLAPPTCRADCLKGMWEVRRHMEAELELLNKTSYAQLCRQLREYKSGCGRAGARGKTCRKKRAST
jgi:hypothetical protein